MFADQIISGDHLFQCVGGKGIDARQVLNDCLLVGAQLSFLFLNGDARPVADILAAAGQIVEHGGFAAVGVSG